MYTQNQTFSTVRSDSAIILKIMRGERPTAQLEEIANAGIRSIISDTWKTDPSERPAMSAIVETLIKIRREGETFFGVFFTRYRDFCESCVWIRFNVPHSFRRLLDILNWFTAPLLSLVWRRR